VHNADDTNMTMREYEEQVLMSDEEDNGDGSPRRLRVLLGENVGNVRCGHCKIRGAWVLKKLLLWSRIS
jgi:hypothetical protein